MGGDYSEGWNGEGAVEGRGGEEGEGVKVK